MTFLYDSIFILFALCYLPVFLLKGKMHAGFGMRLGRIERARAFRRPVWIHAVSVGEAVSMRRLVEELRQRLGEQQFVISTVTATGNAIARTIARKDDAVLYLPLDISGIVRRVLDRVDPGMIVLAETELWPNFITEASRRGIPIVLVNGRISDRSLPRYRMARALVAPLLNRLRLCCVQTEQDALRLQELGMASDKIVVTGNVKFDIAVKDYEDLKKEYADYRLRLGLGGAERIVVAASTHPGEEEAVFGAYRRLVPRFPQLRLFIAPRHPERAAAVAAMIERSNAFAPALVSACSRLQTDGGFRPDGAGRRTVFILDTIGQLMYLYALADLVFVGGSLVPIGGHNILEPASLGKPVVFGTHMFNFRDIAGLFLANRAALQVGDSGQLEEAIASLVLEPARAEALGAAGRDLISRNRGATGRTAERIAGLFNRSHR